MPRCPSSWPVHAPGLLGRNGQRATRREGEAQTWDGRQKLGHDQGTRIHRGTYAKGHSLSESLWCQPDFEEARQMALLSPHHVPKQQFEEAPGPSVLPISTHASICLQIHQGCSGECVGPGHAPRQLTVQQPDPVITLALPGLPPGQVALPGQGLHLFSLGCWE